MQKLGRVVLRTLEKGNVVMDNRRAIDVDVYNTSTHEVEWTHFANRQQAYRALKSFCPNCDCFFRERYNEGDFCPNCDAYFGESPSEFYFD